MLAESGPVVLQAGPPACSVRIGNRLIAHEPADGALPTLYAATADIPGGAFAGPGGFGGTGGAPKPAKHVAQSAEEPPPAVRSAVGVRLKPSRPTSSLPGCHPAAGLRSAKSRKNGDVTHSYPPSFAAAWRSRTRPSILSAAMPNWMPRPHSAAMLAASSSNITSGSMTPKKPLIAVTSKPAWRADRGRSSTTVAGTPFRSSTS